MTFRVRSPPLKFIGVASSCDNIAPEKVLLTLIAHFKETQNFASLQNW
jgi:hypothetical protein